MLNDEQIKVINKLLQLDIDGIHAYSQALKHIKDPEIYENLNEIRKDHYQHIEDLGMLLLKSGKTPPPFEKDFKGYIIEGFTSFLSITGSRGALKAMEINEELINKSYFEGLANNDMPNEVKELLRKNYQDERRHLDYIRICLKSLKDTE